MASVAIPVEAQEPESALRRLIDLPKNPHAIPTGFPLIDEAWGGGLHPGRTCFLAGAPGAGKTTLALKLADAVGQYAPVLFVSGEESEGQVRSTADRLGIASPNVYFLYASDLDVILVETKRLKPELLIVNSINTCIDSSIRGGPSSSSQIKHCGLRFIQWTAERSLFTILIGHLTWKHHSQGPRTVEHEVDLVTYLTVDPEGARQLQVRKSRVCHSPAVYPVPHFGS